MKISGDKMNVKELATVLVFASPGWALCGATMGLGMAFTSEENRPLFLSKGKAFV